ncbi:hypothetical protein, partial [Klebsiella pneumoniae]|uniref:hypothetical protein n=1 Tax=Klebsiella pneumoniae TaxID=573 RepID=UPI001D0D09D1
LLVSVAADQTPFLKICLPSGHELFQISRSSGIFYAKLPITHSYPSRQYIIYPIFYLHFIYRAVYLFM